MYDKFCTFGIFFLAFWKKVLHNFFKNNYKKEIEILKNSLEKFNKTINEMINFINKKLEEFNKLIKKKKKKRFYAILQ